MATPSRLRALLAAGESFPFGGGIRLPGAHLDVAAVQLLREWKWKAFPREERHDGDRESAHSLVQPGDLLGTKVAKGATLTPYANAITCPAHCAYCSEDLLQQEQEKPNSNARYLVNAGQGYKDYQAVFAELVDNLHANGLQVGLSLSGLEATAVPQWMRLLMDVVSSPSGQAVFPYKVLYTNGAGLVDEPELARGLDKLEWHRDHYDEGRNQASMRIERTWKVRENEHFEAAVRAVRAHHPHVHLAVVAILNKAALGDAEDVLKFSAWARELGFDTAIFREICRVPPEEYEDNIPLRWIVQNRVSIEGIFPEVTTENVAALQEASVGYYYYHEKYDGNSLLGVHERPFTLQMEASCWDTFYNVTRDSDGPAHKLVLHSNGNLTRGWSRNVDVVAQGSTWQTPLSPGRLAARPA